MFYRSSPLKRISLQAVPRISDISDTRYRSLKSKINRVISDTHSLYDISYDDITNTLYDISYPITKLGWKSRVPSNLKDKSLDISPETVAKQIRSKKKMIRKLPVVTSNSLNKVFGDLESFAIDKAKDYTTNKLKNYFGFSLIINRNNIFSETALKDFINKYVKDADKKFDSTGFLVDLDFIARIDTNTYFYVKQMESDTSNYNSVNVYIFGKKSYKYFKELKKNISESIKILLYEINKGFGGGSSNGFSSTSRGLNIRDIDTLFYEDTVKESIINHIDRFINNERLYHDRSLLYKTGILLYGEPGTGKSSLVSAIATKYKYDIVSINMNDFSDISTTDLTNSINCDNDRYIILLEDIDTIFNSLDREQDADKDEKAVINKLLQFLDSNTSPTNVIFIATTNHIDKLDAAILRDGRFDLKVEVKGINSRIAAKMCESFGLNHDDTTLILSNQEFPINQSKLQGLILSQLKAKSLKND